MGPWTSTLKGGLEVQIGTYQPDPRRTFKGAVLHNRSKTVRMVKRPQMCHEIGENVSGNPPIFTFEESDSRIEEV